MTAFGLDLVRWRSRRDPGGGPALVTPGFLAGAGDGRTMSAIAGVHGYFAGLLGHPRKEYDADVPAEIAGDRRLGHGLAAACGDWYRWRARTFAEALPTHVARALADAGVDTPSALRLRLFDLVNELHRGFVPSSGRGDVLAALAGSLGLIPADANALDVAMTLDAEGEAVLVREGDAPAAVEIAGRYNRAVLAALLRGSERIVVTVHEPDGSLVRRLYALCRKLGVYCDVSAGGPVDGESALDPRSGGRRVAEHGPLPLHTAPFRLTLAGPDAVVGPPAAAGPRLATVALRMLDELGPHDRAVADLVLRDRPYRLILDRAALRAPGLSAHDATADPETEETDAVYDSEVEARFAREFAALRRQGRAAGWTLVREPAPLMAGHRVVIPDFALVRGDLRVFVEIAGFWTPGYLAKKREALDRLPPDLKLIVTPAEATLSHYTGVPFPLVPYRDRVPVHAVLRSAEQAFGDFTARTAGARERLAALCTAAGERWLDEERLAVELGCHTPGEVGRTLDALTLPPGWERIPGAGLYPAATRTQLDHALTSAWEEGSERLTPEEVRALVPDVDLPSSREGLILLLARSTACAVVSGSLFDVEIRPPDWDTRSPEHPAPAPEVARPRPDPAPRPAKRRAPSSPAPSLF